LNYEPLIERVQFIEEVGLIFESVGLPRMAGRIFGCLLISDPPYQSSGALAAELQASKGSISTMTRLLVQIGLIERVSRPADRRDYFQIKPNAWYQVSQQRLAQISAFRQLAERGLSLLQDASPYQRRRLQEMHDIHVFWERELPILNQRWEQEQQAMNVLNGKERSGQ
jgi:DNA-binding transcriptional regulator GbsR (MarR family)